MPDRRHLNFPQHGLLYGARWRSMLYCLYPNPSMVTQWPRASILVHTSGYRSLIQDSTCLCFSVLVVVLYQLLRLRVR